MVANTIWNKVGVGERCTLHSDNEKLMTVKMKELFFDYSVNLQCLPWHFFFKTTLLTPTC